jgi:hypothetical protein
MFKSGCPSVWLLHLHHTHSFRSEVLHLHFLAIEIEKAWTSVGRSLRGGVMQSGQFFSMGGTMDTMIGADFMRLGWGYWLEVDVFSVLLFLLPPCFSLCVPACTFFSQHGIMPTKFSSPLVVSFLSRPCRLFDSKSYVARRLRCCCPCFRF